MSQLTVDHGGMTGTLPRKSPQPEPEPQKRGYRNVGIPEHLWEQIKVIADADERSVNWIVGRAVRDYLERRKAASQG